MQVIREPRPRSARWLSTSIPEAQWQSSLARTSSAEYNVNNLVSPVLFQEALWHIPEHAVVLEIAPHALLQVSTWSAWVRPTAACQSLEKAGVAGKGSEASPPLFCVGRPEARCEVQLQHHPLDEEGPQR